MEEVLDDDDEEEKVEKSCVEKMEKQEEVASRVQDIHHAGIEAETLRNILTLRNKSQTHSSSRNNIEYMKVTNISGFCS